MKKTTTLLGLLFALSACTSAGSFTNTEPFYYSRTTNILGFSYDSIYYCQKGENKGPTPKLDCKKVDAKYDETGGKPKTSGPWEN